VYHSPKETLNPFPFVDVVGGALVSPKPYEAPLATYTKGKGKSVMTMHFSFVRIEHFPSDCLNFSFHWSEKS